MTMQTTTLPFQVSGASALTHPQAPLQRNAAAGVQAPDSMGFSATLSRAMAPAAAPTPTPAAGPANKPAAAVKQADKPAAQGPKAPVREPDGQNETSPEAPTTAQPTAGTEKSADPASDAEAAESAAAAAEAATTPVTDMLAFMASLAQPVPAVVAAVATEAAAAPPATEAPTAAVAGAGLQAAALESAFTQLAGTDGAAAADPDLAVSDVDTASFAPAAGVQREVGESATLRAPQQAAQTMVQADAGKVQPHTREPASAAAAVEAPVPGLTQLQVQATKLDNVPNAAAIPGDRIPARVGSQAWDNQVSQRIVYMVGKEQAATLTLNPPDLGPVQVVLNVSNDGASVAFSSNQQEVRQALENALPRLREMMSESGIALGNATVDAGTPDQRQARQDGERRHGGGGGVGNLTGAAASTDEGAARPATRTVALGDSGMVDTFA